MGVVTTVVNATVIGVVGVLLAWYLKDRFEKQLEAIDRRFRAIDQRFDAVDHRIDSLEERLDRRIGGLQASVDSMRSDLTQVALAVGVRPRARNQ